MGADPECAVDYESASDDEENRRREEHRIAEEKAEAARRAAQPRMVVKKSPRKSGASNKSESKSSAPEPMIITNSTEELEVLREDIAQRKTQWPWSRCYQETKQWRGLASSKYGYKLYECEQFRKAARNAGTH